jgi:hypothetical protein
MTHLTTILRAAIGAALCLALNPAHAASGALQGAGGYYESCMKSVEFPRPFGEWDLKGNPKLPQYCECYVPAFTAQNTQARANLQAHGGPPTPEMIKENKASELAVRNTCRKQVGLPPVYDPNVNAPGAKAKRASKRTS